MNIYQISVFIMLGSLILSVLIVGFIEELIKRHKRKKQYIKHLERENKMLNNKIKATQLIAELKGWDLDV